MSLLFYIFLIITSDVSNAQILKLIQNFPRNCEEELTTISKKYYNNIPCVTIVEQHENIYTYQKLKLPKTFLKRPIIANETDCDDFLILASDLRNFKDNYTKINPNSKILIHFIEEDLNSIQLKQLGDSIWKKYHNPNIIIMNSNCGTYLYKPFSFVDGSWGTFTKINPKEIPIIENDIKTLNGYPFRVIIFNSIMAYKIVDNKSTSEYGGLDALLCDALAKYMEFNKVVLPDIPPTFYGEMKPDGSVTGALKYLIEGDIEFISTAYFLKDYSTRDIEFSSVGMGDDLCVIIHKGAVMPIWEIFRTYNEVWLLLVLSYIAQGITWMTIKKLETTYTQRNNQHNSTLLDTFRLIIASSFSREAYLLSERLFLLFSMFGTVIFLGAFQGSLITIFSSPIHYPDVKTLEQLAKHDLAISTRFQGLKDDVFGRENETGSQVMHKLRSMVFINASNMDNDWRIVTVKNAAGLIRRTGLELDNKTRYFDETGENILYVVDECPRSYSLAYILPRKSAFAPRINTLILRASQGGFFSKWYKDMARNTTLSTRKSRLDQIAAADQSKHKKFSLDDLVMGFYVIIIGNAISGVVLMVEIGYCVVRKKLESRKARNPRNK